MEDGSTLHFNSAFYEERDDFYDIYTEHCGYHRLLKYNVDELGNSPLPFIMPDDIQAALEKFNSEMAISFAFGFFACFILSQVIAWLH